MNTKTIDLETLAAREDGTYLATKRDLAGQPAVYTTWEGDRLVGTLELDPNRDGGYMRIRFEDGRWARTDDIIELVV